MRYAGQLLAALACLHAAGMAHRDVKPANCLFFAGELKLADFGLLTAAGLAASRLGTLRYMPPDGYMDARADVYAAGLVIYEMISGLGAERFPSLGPRAKAIADDRRLGRLEPAGVAGVRSRPEPAVQRRPRDARRVDGRRAAARPRRRRWPWLLAGMVMGGGAGAFLALAARPSVSVNFVSSRLKRRSTSTTNCSASPMALPTTRPAPSPASPAESITSSSSGTPKATHRISPAQMASSTPAKSISAANRQITGRCKAEH